MMGNGQNGGKTTGMSTRDNEMLGTMLEGAQIFIYLFIFQAWGLLRDDDNAQKHVKDIVIYF